MIGSFTVDYYIEHWTVTSVTPRIERVESLDERTVQALRDRDIRYLTQLEGWKAEAHWEALRKNLSPQQYADLRRLTALYLHQGIGVDYGNWLVRAGIGSLEVLGATSTEAVLAQLRASAATEPLPTPARVRVWIRRIPSRWESRPWEVWG